MSGQVIDSESEKKWCLEMMTTCSFVGWTGHRPVNRFSTRHCLMDLNRLWERNKRGWDYCEKKTDLLTMPRECSEGKKYRKDHENNVNEWQDTWNNMLLSTTLNPLDMSDLNRPGVCMVLMCATYFWMSIFYKNVRWSKTLQSLFNIEVPRKPKA